MAIITAFESFMPLTLPLEDDHVKVSKYLFSLRFNLQIGYMYMEQKIIPWTAISWGQFWFMCQDGHDWILNAWSFRIIGQPTSHMQTSTVLFTNESGTYTVNVHNVATIKIELSDDDNFALLDSDEDVCLVDDLFISSLNSYKTKPSNLVLVFVDVVKTTHNQSDMKLVCHGFPSQCPPLHSSWFSSSFNIIIFLNKNHKV